MAKGDQGGLGRPRYMVIEESKVGLYHVFQQTVRQSFLLGVDPETGVDCSHRRKAVTDRVALLSHHFAIDTCTIAVLSNHYHLILRNRVDVASRWSDIEVAVRWWRLTNEELTRASPVAAPSDSELAMMLSEPGRVKEWRKRLSSPSWFMQRLNQPLAYRFNREDNVRGHFFADRFGAYKLENEADVTACSLYVDLNAIRAGLAELPESAFHSSVYRRLWRLRQRDQWMVDGQLERANYYGPTDPDLWLAPIDERAEAPPLGAAIPHDLGGSMSDSAQASESGEAAEAEAAEAEAAEAFAEANDASNSPAAVEREEGRERLTLDRDGFETLSGDDALRRHGFLPMTLEAYLTLLDELGRLEKEGEGRIDPEHPPLFARLGLDPTNSVAGRRASTQSGGACWPEGVNEAQFAMAWARVAWRCEMWRHDDLAEAKARPPTSRPRSSEHG